VSKATTVVDIRSDDEDLHPQAIVREEDAIEDARSKRLRAWAGGLGVVLSGLAFVVALYRDNTFVLVGSLLGVLVSGNVIPYTVVRDIIVLRFRGGSS
jgi:hypothetical protein